MNIYLYGPPGSGKSSVGKILAGNLNLPVFDLDQKIEELSKLSIPEIFSASGEAAFREIERNTLEGILKMSSAVIALGGGALLDQRNRELVHASGVLFCLNAPLEVLKKRLQEDAPNRPLLSGNLDNKLSDLLSKRATHYGSFENQINTAELTPEGAAWKIQVTIGRFYLRGMGNGYEVRVKEGQLIEIGNALLEQGLKGPVALVTDDNVGSYYGELVLKSLTDAGFKTRYLSLKPGESSKNIETVNQIWDSFLEGGLERGSTVIALGGGVIGDMSGFAASTYMRGVAWVCVPTSLLAMVDSSLGGKTAIDLPQGKNLVGTFHAPRLVWVDPQTLMTLPEIELRNGLAEVVKHGVIGDLELFEMCESGWGVVRQKMSEIVRRAIGVKVRVILEDPYEKGTRQVLNLGHTIGHGVEIASNFQLMHGEAVSIGMVAAARISEGIGLAQNGLSRRIEQALRQLGLPVEIPAGIDLDTMNRAMLFDKKKTNGKLRFALPVQLVEMKYGIEVENWEKFIK